MSEIIKTVSIGSGILDVKEDFVLDEKPMSRLIFHANIHNEGIRGKIIRQRRESKIDSWIPDKAIDIRTLEKNESINFDISTEAVNKLYSAISKLAGILKQYGIEYGENTYAIVDPKNTIITEENKAEYIRIILEAGYDDEMWNILDELRPDLVKNLSYAKIQIFKAKIVNELKSRLETGEYSETIGDQSWQKWIYENNWLFGVNYKEPLEKVRININGIMPDYLFPTLDGFVDILEIKLPIDDVINEDKSHRGSWKLSQETNKAIGQVVNYLAEIDRLRYEIEKNVKNQYKYEISLLKPRAYILIGNSSSWDSLKKEGLRKLNHALHGIEVLTYQDLLDRGSQATKLKL